MSQDHEREIAECLKDAGIRIQIVLALLACGAGVILHLSAMEWAAVVICIALVISTEILNTCVEKLCDLYKNSFDERIRVIKDMAAAAVLVSAAGALVTALIILMRHM